MKGMLKIHDLKITDEKLIIIIIIIIIIMVA